MSIVYISGLHAISFTNFFRSTVPLVAFSQLCFVRFKLPAIMLSLSFPPVACMSPALRRGGPFVRLSKRVWSSSLQAPRIFLQYQGAEYSIAATHSFLIGLISGLLERCPTAGISHQIASY